jgi:hypothetical protein
MIFACQFTPDKFACGIYYHSGGFSPENGYGRLAFSGGLYPGGGNNPFRIRPAAGAYLFGVLRGLFMGIFDDMFRPGFRFRKFSFVLFLEYFRVLPVFFRLLYRIFDLPRPFCHKLCYRFKQNGPEYYRQNNNIDDGNEKRYRKIKHTVLNTVMSAW